MDCSSVAGNASPLCFANRVHLVFVDGDTQHSQCLRQHAACLYSRSGHVVDTAVAEACTSMA